MSASYGTAFLVWLEGLVEGLVKVWLEGLIWLEGLVGRFGLVWLPFEDLHC